MKPGDWFVLALFVLNALAAVTYAVTGQHGKAVYWAGATLINGAVLWGWR